MTAPAPERNFVFFPRGEVREEILTSFRFGLRQVPNPDTNVAFTETEIATATARLSRFFIEADAIDLVLLAAQNRDLFFVDQARVDRSNHNFLQNFHGVQWDVQQLPASGASGSVSAPATVGTIFAGSTTIGDPASVFGTDPQQLRFQVLFTDTATAGGITVGGSPADGVVLQIKGIDTGPATNLDAGVEVTWSNGPPGAPEPAIVDEKFTGGFGAETDAEYARRILLRIRDKEAAGNNAQFRAWGKQASTAVEEAFIYATALHAGSVRVVITQKRGDIQGPAGREAAVGTLTDVTAFLTPPGSPVVPVPPFVVVTDFDGVGVQMTLGLSLPFGQNNGWEDLEPWPTLGTSSPESSSVTAITTQLIWKMTRGAGSANLPTGITNPSMMAQNPSTSRWEKLQVQSVTLDAGDVFDVVLSAAPSFTLVAGATTGTRISPDTLRRTIIAETIEGYFDSLGPGELVDLASDNRAHRAFRFPRPNEEFPQRAGTAVLFRLQDVLASSLANAQAPEITPTTPTVPTNPADKPEMMVAGRIGIYPE